MKKQTRSNKFLRECMGEAIFKLLKKKSISEISITQITELANVGRATFYRNYDTKEDLIMDYISTLFYKWDLENNQILSSENSPDFLKKTTLFLEFVESVKELISLLVKQNLFYIVIEIFLQIFDITHEEITALKYKNIFTSFGIAGIAIAWVMSGMKESSEELANILVHEVSIIQQNDFKTI